MNFRSEIEIQASAEDVFRYCLNPKNLKNWMDGFQRFKQLSGRQRQAGAKLMLVFKDKAGELEVNEQIVEVTKGKLIRSELSNKNMRTQQSFRFLNQGGTCKILIDTKVQLRPAIFNLFGFFVKGPMQKQQGEDLQRLKQVIENQTT